MKYLFLVVLYKKKISECETIESLARMSGEFDKNFVIWDNGGLYQDELELDSLKKLKGDFFYICDGKNTGLAHIYNKISNENIFDYIVILDHDTNLPNNYLFVLDGAIKSNNDIKLFLPLIYSENKLVSPGDLHVFKGKHWRKEVCGLVDSKSKLAITSGMALSKKYIANNKKTFDERLRLYGIDTRFMVEYARNEDKFFVFPAKIIHHTMLWSNPAADIMLFRFRNLRRSWFIVFSDSTLKVLMLLPYSVFVSIKMAIKYKDIRFVFGWDQ